MLFDPRSAHFACTVSASIDMLVLVAYLASAIVVGLVLSGKSKNLEAFLLGDRNLPWWAILGSIVATETSAATVLSVPGEGFGPTGMKFLQLALGYIVGRVLIVQFLLPLYFRGQMLTAYEVLNDRFGGVMRQAASLLFLVARNVGRRTAAALWRRSCCTSSAPTWRLRAWSSCSLSWASSRPSTRSSAACGS